MYDKCSRKAPVKCLHEIESKDAHTSCSLQHDAPAPARDVPQHLRVELLQQPHVQAPCNILQRPHVREVTRLAPERDTAAVPVTDDLYGDLFLVYYATLADATVFAPQAVQELADYALNTRTAVGRLTVALNIRTQVIACEDSGLVAYHGK